MHVSEILFQEPSLQQPSRPSAAEAEAPAAPEGRPAGLRGIEKAALAVVGLILLVAGFVFLQAMLPDNPADPGDPAQSKPKLPVKGTLVTVSEVETFWRDRIEGDAAKPETKFLPAVKLQTSGGSGNGYLQVLLRDPDGRIRGDSHTFPLQGGRPASGDGSQCLAVGTEGYGNPLLFMEYRGNLEKNWTVELLESKEQKAPADQWRRIAYFEMSKRYVPKDSTGD
jgi:hypothetical protein